MGEISTRPNFKYQVSDIFWYLYNCQWIRGLDTKTPNITGGLSGGGGARKTRRRIRVGDRVRLRVGCLVWVQPREGVVWRRFAHNCVFVRFSDDPQGTRLCFHLWLELVDDNPPGVDPVADFDHVPTLDELP